MKNKILYILLGIMVVLNIGLIVFVGKSNDSEYECNCDDVQLTDDEKLQNGYMELNDKMIEYLKEIYDTDEYVNEDGETTVYTITLGEISKKGYDISMFVDPVTGKQCNLDESYGRFIILGTREDGTLDYTYNVNIDCFE